MNVVGQTVDSIPPKLELNGYIKDMISTYIINENNTIATGNLIHNRLNFKYTFSPKWSSRLEMRNRIFYGEHVKLIPNFGEIINQYNGLVSLSHLWSNDENFIAQSVIDRILLKYADEKWEVTLGRQRINWGINNVWNPNDIFNAYNFLDFDYEERPGSDAVRVLHNLKNDSGIEMAWKIGKNKNEHTGAILYRFNKWQYDFQFLSGIYLTDFVVGGGWAGNIKNTGFKGECSYFIPRPDAPDSSKSFSFSLMADQTFKNNWYISFVSLYNSNPSNSLAGTLSIGNSGLSPKSLFPFRYNFYTMVTKTLSPISSVNLSTIYSPENNTLILVPTYTWNIAANFDLDLLAQSYFSNQNESYQNIINQLYLRGRWSF